MERRLFLSGALASLPLVAWAQTVAAKKGGAVRVAAGEDRYGVARPRPFGTSAFKVATKDSGGGLFVMEHRLTKKGGPPLHLHHGEDELFYVMEGEFLMDIGGERFKAKAGDSVLGPKGIPHTWAFVGDTPGKMLFVFAPAGKMEDYFLERDRRGGALIEDAAFLHAYGMELLGPGLKVE
jgi:mannose-6-phosphate isomerase-like protein (cupin superfamily)